MRWTLAAVTLLMFAEPSFAAAPVSCLDALADPKARIAACTRILEKSETADAYIARANALADDVQWELAIADLGKALALHPKHAEALAARAGLYELMGDRNRALADIDRALAIEPSARLHVMRGDILASRDDARAVSEYTKALAIDPRDAGALTSRARAYERLSKDALARDDYDRAVDVGPNDPDARLERGRYFAKHLRLSQAVKDFSAAISLDPHNMEAFRERAKAYLRRSEFDAALADLDRVLTIRPKDLSARRIRRNVYLRIGDSSRAIADAGVVLASAEYVYTDDYLERGVAYLRRGGEAAFRQAESDFKEAAKIERGDRNAAMKYAQAVCQILCPARRARMFARALLAAAPSRNQLDRNRDIADADAYMGMLALKRGDDAGAARRFADAMGISSESAVAIFGRGVVKFNAGDIEGAKDDFVLSREHHNNMAGLYASAGIEPIPARSAIVVEPPPDSGIERDLAICRNGGEVLLGPGGKVDMTPQIDACARVTRAELSQELRAEAYVHRARWRAMGGDRTGGMEDHAAALALDPKNVDALIAGASTLAAKKQFAEARALFDRALKVDEKSFLALLGRCEALAGMGQAKAALDDCDRAVLFSGGQPVATMRRASILLRAGENKRALRDFDLALREFARFGLPDDAYARFGRGVALQRLGDTTAAALEFGKARAQNPDIDREFAALGVTPP